MDFEKQKPVSDQYRINFDLVFGGRGYTWSKPAPPIQVSYVPDPESFETDMTVTLRPQKDDL